MTGLGTCSTSEFPIRMSAFFQSLGIPSFPAALACSESTNDGTNAPPTMVPAVLRKCLRDVVLMMSPLAAQATAARVWDRAYGEEARVTSGGFPTSRERFVGSPTQWESDQVVLVRKSGGSRAGGNAELREDVADVAVDRLSA